jgi:hypothetical protein
MYAARWLRRGVFLADRRTGPRAAQDKKQSKTDKNENTFVFDHVFGERSTQAEVRDAALSHTHPCVALVPLRLCTLMIYADADPSAR